MHRSTLRRSLVWGLVILGLTPQASVGEIARAAPGSGNDVGHVEDGPLLAPPMEAFGLPPERAFASETAHGETHADQEICGGPTVLGGYCSFTFRGNPLTVSGAGAGLGLYFGRGTVIPVLSRYYVEVWAPQGRYQPILSCSSLGAPCTASATVDLGPGTPLTCEVRASIGAFVLLGTYRCSSGAG